MNKEKLYEEIKWNVYKEMCCGCPNAKRCHDECEECDDYYENVNKECKRYGFEPLY